jgi:hypothetical protein
MEAVLLAVTLVSLATAIGTSFLAWRVMQAERLRSEARIAALAADLDTDHHERPVRSAQLKATPPPTPAIATPAIQPEIELTIADPAVPDSQCMFADRPRGRSMARVVAGVGVAAAIVVLVIGTLVMTSDRSASGRSRPAQTRHPVAAPVATTPSAEVPLELIALGHEREKDRLTVRGVVRGAATAEGGPLTAVVLLFNRQGSEIGSGRADVAPAGSDPAGERTFVITVPSTGDVGRYRISFRSDDHVVPHVDKRSPSGFAKPAVLNVANSQF